MDLLKRFALAGLNSQGKPYFRGLAARAEWTRVSLLESVDGKGIHQRHLRLLGRPADTSTGPREGAGLSRKHRLRARRARQAA